jgi:hypothetical protein
MMMMMMVLPMNCAENVWTLETGHAEESWCRYATVSCMVRIKVKIFRDMTPSSLVKGYEPFRRTYCPDIHVFLNQYSFFRVRDQVWHPYKTRGKNMGLYVLLVTLL